MTTIPYAHWMYFADREAAEQCAAELSGLNFLCGVDFSPPPSEKEKASLAPEHPALAGSSEPPPHGNWLLRSSPGDY